MFALLNRVEGGAVLFGDETSTASALVPILATAIVAPVFAPTCAGISDVMQTPPKIAKKL